MIHTWLMIVASVSSESYNDLLKMPEGLFWRVLQGMLLTVRLDDFQKCLAKLPQLHLSHTRNLQ